MMQSNILVKAGALGVAAIAGSLLVFKVSARNHHVDPISDLSLEGGAPISVAIQETLGVEADTPQDTIGTLIAEVRDYKQRMDKLVEENTTLRQENERFMSMEQNVIARLDGVVEERAKDMGESTQTELSHLKSQMSNVMQTITEQAKALEQTSQQIHSSEQLAQSETVWLDGMGEAVIDKTGGNRLSLNRFGLSENVNPTPSFESLVVEPALTDPVIPVYTIPKNATLLNATAFSALVGRVPIGANVTDPYSFKVILGKDNLAANGHEIPHLSYAVASGKAIGDWTMSCVAGDVTSITFIFEDGRIRTIPTPSDITAGGTVTPALKIGELSDNFGNPCVPGQKVSNAASYLAARVIAASAEAAAESSAASETTTTVSDVGLGARTVIDGDTGKYILDKALSGAANESAAWIRDRQSLEFDAIYVKPGAKVGVNLTEELRIDYDPAGRMTIHSANFNGDKYRALD
jgi:cell division protein ZapB